MTDLEALEITYNMAVKYSKGPLTDVEMDALLQVRATIEQIKENLMQYEDQLVIGNVFNTIIQQILTEFEGNADPNLIAALAQGILVRLDQSGYVIVKK